MLIYTLIYPLLKCHTHLNTSHVNVNPLEKSHSINLLSLPLLINSSFTNFLPSKWILDFIFLFSSSITVITVDSRFFISRSLGKILFIKNSRGHCEVVIFCFYEFSKLVSEKSSLHIFYFLYFKIKWNFISNKILKLSQFNCNYDFLKIKQEALE